MVGMACTFRSAPRGGSDQFRAKRGLLPVVDTGASLGSNPRARLFYRVSCLILALCGRLWLKVNSWLVILILDVLALSVLCERYQNSHGLLLQFSVDFHKILPSAIAK